LLAAAADLCRLPLLLLAAVAARFGRVAVGAAVPHVLHLLHAASVRQCRAWCHAWSVACLLVVLYVCLGQLDLPVLA
jgi:hypothetical protein